MANCGFHHLKTNLQFNLFCNFLINNIINVLNNSKYYKGECNFYPLIFRLYKIDSCVHSMNDMLNYMYAVLKWDDLQTSVR